MTLILIDPYRVAASLKDRGFSDDQAEGITEALKSLDLEMLASKGDLADLKVELAALETRLTVRLATFIGIAVAVQSAIIAAIQLFGA